VVPTTAKVLASCAEAVDDSMREIKTADNMVVIFRLFRSIDKGGLKQWKRLNSYQSGSAGRLEGFERAQRRMKNVVRSQTECSIFSKF
jgi:hypothetical protein